MQGKVVKKSPKKNFGKSKMSEWPVKIVQSEDKLDLHKESEKEKDWDLETPLGCSSADDTGDEKLGDTEANEDIGSDDSQA